MIILPVEKKIDWVRAPIILFGLVILNCLIFFLYQNGDDEKVGQAIELYQKADYFEREWPAYQSYLVSTHQNEKLKSLEDLMEKEDLNSVSYALLSDEAFYPYLLTHADNNFENSYYSEWKIKREEIMDLLSSTSVLKFGLRADQPHWYSFVTHQFMHGSTMHLLGNMVFLVVCGFAVEAAIGHFWFLTFYLLSGIAGGTAQVFFNPETTAPLVGASGAISGVMAMYLAVFRFKKIEFFYWLFFFVGYFRAPALLILPFYIGKEIYSFYHSDGSNVAFMAHAGGFTLGALLIGSAFVFKLGVVNKTYVEEQDPSEDRRQRLADVYEAIEKFRFDRALNQLNELIQIYGVNFELAKIKYNLLKINRGPNFSQSVLHLLSFNLISQGEIKSLDKVWRDNPELHCQLTEAERLKLGMQLASLENPESAEQIFLTLKDNACLSPAMAVLASKLANAFGVLRESEKKSHYELMAKQYANPLTQGAALRSEQGS